MAQTDPHQAPERYRFVVGGLQDRPALIATPAHQEGVAVELTPLGSRALLGMPAGELWDTSVEAADVLLDHAQEALPLLRRFHQLGYRLYATTGTARYLNQNDIPAEPANKIHEDGVARSFGFTGALVPGVELFARGVVHTVETRRGNGGGAGRRQGGVAETDAGGGVRGARARPPEFSGQLVTVICEVRHIRVRLFRTPYPR